MEAHRRSFSAWAVALALTLCAGFVSSGLAVAATPAYPQDEVEAAFLYRFAGFVRWPPGALAPSVFTVAVLDDDAVADDLERMLMHKQLRGRPARVRRIASIEDLGDAQILYIGDSDESSLKRWLARIAGRPVLVVTGQPGALDDGSTINFEVIDSHVRFEISLATARRSGLTISADLLSVATHVEGGPIGSEAPCETPTPRLQQRFACSPRLASQ
jgi:YfiR/HmsC-like